MFESLGSQYQDVILDITQRMGAGMAEFIPKEVSMCESNPMDTAFKV